MKILVGTSGYAYKEWKGKFYPEKISSKEMLRFYAERFSAVEINNTFYRMPKEDVLRSWAEQVPDDFVFAIKAPQIITHLKRLKNVAKETEHLFRTLSALDRKLGPVLFQFPASFRVDLPSLKDFLDLVPRDISCAFDFRSPSWTNSDVQALLHKSRCGLCMEDTVENPVKNIISTAPWGYLRLRRPDYGDEDLSQWMEKTLLQQWEKAYAFFKHEEGGGGAETAMRFRELAESQVKRVAGGGRKK
jgi:uncharacterized protein YecE (DUF72 family)